MSASPPPGSARPNRIVDCFHGRIPRFRFRFFYAVGLLVIASAMVLLPLAYLSLIGLVGYGIYYHALENSWIYADARGSIRVKIFLMLVYGAPFLIGPVMIVFMLKPIFARRSHEREPLTLDRSQEPVLYEVLEKLCDAIGAPMPREIEVDCQLNAAAGFRAGVVSFFGRHMSLVIGLPLAAGLPLDQFMGVLAHELGHFSQGFGMRLSYVVRGINGWFGRVVYERDTWDEELAESSRNVDFRFGIFLYIARFGIWINRKVLWLLMVCGHCICCAFLRQMEYDADRVATDVVGAKAYGAALSQLHILAIADLKAHRELEGTWREKRLPDNFPRLIAGMSQSISPADRKRIVEHALTSRTGLVSTHPALRNRLRAVERRGSEGVFQCDAPATALFANFKMIANAVTLTNYRREFGLKVSRNNLFPTEDLLRQHTQSSKDATASLRYFSGCHHLFKPTAPAVSRIEPPADPRAAVAKLRKLRAQFDAASVKYAGYFTDFGEVQERLRDLHVAELLLSAGFRRIDTKSFGISKASNEAIAKARQEANAKLDVVLPKVASMTELLKARMTLALQLACVPAVAAKLRLEQPPVSEIPKLLPIVRGFETSASALPIAARDLSAATALIQNVPQDADVDALYPKLIPILKRLIRESRSTIEGARLVFDGADYPFEHASGSIMMSEFLACRVASDEDFVDVLMASTETMDRLVAIYSRCMGRLVHIAERVERAVGLPASESPAPSAPETTPS